MSLEMLIQFSIGWCISVCFLSVDVDGVGDGLHLILILIQQRIKTECCIRQRQTLSKEQRRQRRLSQRMKVFPIMGGRWVW